MLLNKTADRTLLAFTPKYQFSQLTMYTGVMLLGLFTLCNLHTFKNAFVKKREKTLINSHEESEKIQLHLRNGSFVVNETELLVCNKYIDLK